MNLYKGLFLIFIKIFLSNVDCKKSFDENTCGKSSNCVSLNNTRCLDISLPYKYVEISGFFNSSLTTESDVHNYLEKWTGLKGVPRCWASIQPLLCTVLFPRCEENRVSYLSTQLCKNVQLNCKIIDEFISLNNITNLVPFLNCNDTSIFSSKCKNDYTDIKFNSSAAKCKYPLVTTNDSKIYFKNIEGCALDCDDPLYHKDEKLDFKSFIGWWAFFSMIIVSFSIISYIFMWSSLKQTSKFLFYIQVCFLIHYIGWSMQFFVDKKQIVCKVDRTLRYSEPSKGFLCLINFVLIYYTAFSILAWYAIIAIIMMKFSKKVNLAKHEIKYLHLQAWSISFIFTIMVIAFSAIDSNYLYGICLVGINSKTSRFIFILIPLFFGTSFVIYGMLNRAININLMINKPDININLKKRKDYKAIYKRLGFCSMIMLTILVFSFVVHSNKNSVNEEWLERVRDQIMCLINLMPIFTSKPHCFTNCHMKYKTNLMMDYTIIIFVFGSGILSSMWNINSITVNFWILKFKRKKIENVRTKDTKTKDVFLSKLFKFQEQDPVKMNLSTIFTNQESNATNHENINLGKSTNYENKDTSYLSIHQRHLEKKEQKIYQKKLLKESKKNRSSMMTSFSKSTSTHSLEMLNHGQPIYTNPNFFLNQIPFNPTQIHHNQQPKRNDVKQFFNKQLNEENKFLNDEKKSSLFSFTHGMSDQNKNNCLINPFEDKRLLDSRQGNKSSENASDSNTNLNMSFSQASNNPPQNWFYYYQMANMFNISNVMQNMQHQMNPFSCMMGPNIPLFSQFNDQTNFYHQNQLKYQQQLNQQQFSNIQNQPMNYQTIEELEASIRERGDIVHICQGVDSASEANESFIPIVITETESSISSCDFDLNYASRLPSDAEKIVKAKLQQLEQQSSPEPQDTSKKIKKKTKKKK